MKTPPGRNFRWRRSEVEPVNISQLCTDRGDETMNRAGALLMAVTASILTTMEYTPPKQVSKMAPC